MLIFQQEFSKRIKQIEANAIEQEENLFLHNIEVLSADEVANVLLVYKFVKELDYERHGSYENYMNHLLRMCNLCIELCNEYSEELFVTIMVHNVLEVTNISLEELSEVVGKKVANYIHTLTVDRTREWDPAYKLMYYTDIAQSTICACTKIIDKIDNLFLLEINPDERVKKIYINEIEIHVIPMAAKQGIMPNGKEILLNIVSEYYQRNNKNGS